MSQFSALYGVLQRGGKGCLSHHRVEAQRTVLSGRNDIFHIAKFNFVVQRYKKMCKSRNSCQKLCNFAAKMMKL
jgi:hypothetical protein